MSDTLQAARYYASRGWPVFPVHGLVDGHCTCGDPTCSPQNNAKHPATPHGHKDATLDPTTLDFPPELTRNIAIATGSPSHLSVIDIDPRNGGFESWEEFERLFPATDFSTLTVQTGGGGLHLYYDAVTPTFAGLLRGVDLKSDGGYVLAPPSTHISGGTYKTIKAGAPLTPAPLPEPIRQMIQTGERPHGLTRAPGTSLQAAGMTSARQREILRDPKLLGPGERDTFFTFTARDLRRAGREPSEIAATLGAVYERMDNPPDDLFSPEQLIAKIQRAIRDVEPELTRETRDWAAQITAQASSLQARPPDPAPDPDDTPVLAEVVLAEPAPAPDDTPATTGHFLPDGYRLPPEIFERWDGTLPEGFIASDLGVAMLAFAQWGHIVRFNVETQDWLLYDNARGIWLTGREEEVTELVRHTVRSLDRHCVYDIENEAERNQMLQFAVRQSNSQRVRGALTTLRGQPNVIIRSDDLDADTGFMSVQNGVIEPTDFGDDYADVPFRPHRPEDLITRQALFTYDDYTSSPFWEHALARWFPDPDVRRFAQTLMGYAVFGGGQEKVFVVAYGEPDSGKSAFFNNLGRLLGSLAVDIASSALVKQRWGNIAHYELAHIGGARLLIASETDPGDRLDASLIKVLTSGGGDALQVRGMRQNFFTVRNRGLLVILSNHVPENTDLDEGLWKRLVVLPFTGSFQPDDPGTLLPQTLTRMLDFESDGILRWLVEGYSNYVAAARLTVPDAAKTALMAVKEEQDWLTPYIQNRLIDAPGERMSLRDVVLDYEDWCRSSGEEPVGPIIFARSLSKAYPKRRFQGLYHFQGCTLRREPAAQLPESWRRGET